MHAVTSVQSCGCSQAGENVPEAIHLVSLDYTGTVPCQCACVDNPYSDVLL